MTAQAHGPAQPLTLALNPLPRVRNDASNLITAARPANAITCNGCDRWWTGLISAHCSACHESFTSVRCFDLHRRNDKCLWPADVRNRKGETALVPANRPWPGWSEPGTWAGPQSA